MMLDVGPKTIEAVNAWISRATTLVWNGPLGAFEIAPFDTATVSAAKHAAARTREGKLVSVAGGGDTVAALNHAGVADDFTYVSTAGGAFLEWMEGKPLPGVFEISPLHCRSARCVASGTRPARAFGVDSTGRTSRHRARLWRRRPRNKDGFIAALDQSGGSTPKALKLYGVDEGAWSNDSGDVRPRPQDARAGSSSHPPSPATR
jgi:hypothetical protein